MVQRRFELVVVAVHGGQGQLQRRRPVIVSWVRFAVVAGVVMTEREVQPHGERCRPGRCPEGEDSNGDQATPKMRS